MRVLCIARHAFIGEHMARVFARVGAMTEFAVGLPDGVTRALEFRPDVVVCEYDLLATLSLGAWEREEPLSRLPVLAVSLTRSPGDVHPLDTNISSFLYLPTLSDEKATQVLEGAVRSVARAPAVSPLSWMANDHSSAEHPA